MPEGTPKSDPLCYFSFLWLNADERSILGSHITKTVESQGRRVRISESLLEEDPPSFVKINPEFYMSGK